MSAYVHEMEPRLPHRQPEGHDDDGCTDDEPAGVPFRYHTTRPPRDAARGGVEPPAAIKGSTGTAVAIRWTLGVSTVTITPTKPIQNQSAMYEARSVSPAEREPADADGHEHA